MSDIQKLILIWINELSTATAQHLLIRSTRIAQLPELCYLGAQ
jgi:hypothetical protein